MAKLFFRYGTMNSGKSTLLIQVAFNYFETGEKAVLVKPAIDTKSGSVLSRIGISQEVDYSVASDTDLFELIRSEIQVGKQIDAVLIDEAQFLTVLQADQLMKIVVSLNKPVIAYGLRTDFLGKPFPGSSRLLEIADSLEEMRTKCFLCGRKSNYNSRRDKETKEFIKTGEQILIDKGEVEYVPLCSYHFNEKVGVGIGAP
jgi:thymidine kinase